MPTKAAAASTSIARLLSARLPTRCTAWSTIASTAAFRPKKNAATAGTLPKGDIDVAQGHDGDNAGHDEEAARDNGARPAVHQPANIHDNLVRFPPGHQHP